MSQQCQVATLPSAPHLHHHDAARPMPQCRAALFQCTFLHLLKENTSENTIFTSLRHWPPSRFFKGSHSSCLEGSNSSQEISASPLGYFSVAACGIFFQFICMLEVLLPPEIVLHVLARYTSTRRGEHQSRHYVKAGTREHDLPENQQTSPT